MLFVEPLKSTKLNWSFAPRGIRYGTGKNVGSRAVPQAAWEEIGPFIKYCFERTSWIVMVNAPVDTTHRLYASNCASSPILPMADADPFPVRATGWFGVSVVSQ